MITFIEPLKFEWDSGNENKNLEKHNVTKNEAEEVFFDKNKHGYPDPTHSIDEQRKIIVGLTKNERLLFVVYTIRDEKIRVISVRDLNKRKEEGLYEKTT